MNNRFLVVVLLTSVLTGMVLQKFDPVLILLLCLLPWLIVLFYCYPFYLISLWYLLLIVWVLFPDFFLTGGSILFLPLDPAYFFSAVYIAIASILRPESFVKIFKENKILIFFLLLIVVYIIIHTSSYGKSAIGEARKSYFFFFFPVLSSFIVKDFKDIQRLLFLFLLVGVVCLVVALSRFFMGFPLRSLSSAGMNLILLFQVFSILIVWLNKGVIINRFIDASILVFSIAILVLRPHRTVMMASAFGLFLIFFMFRNRLQFILKILVFLVAFFTLIVIAMFNVPTFEKASITPLKGILDPQSDGTGSWRMEGWRQQLSRLSLEEFLFGKGFGNYFMWYDRKTRSKITNSPHNGYVQMILKIGLLGLVFYGLLAFTFLRKVIPVRKKLPPGPMRAFVEISILNFGAVHAYMLGYGFGDGFCEIALLFYAMGMSAARLFEEYGKTVGQLESKIPDPFLLTGT